MTLKRKRRPTTLTINSGSWDDFEADLRTLRPGHNLLFRGHEDSRWKLTTTLERNGREIFSVEDYYRLIARIKPQVETFTNLKWDTPSHEDVKQLTADYDTFSRGLHNMPAYTYMAYLRHNGFPSPLLDWTKSVYVAAYFAFRRPVADEVSIYLYSDGPQRFKISSSDEAQIQRLGPYVQTHKRHFLQQSEYTVCTAFLQGIERGFDGWHFVPHQRVFDAPNKTPNQDIVWKFNLPASERAKVLSLLDAYNLNAYSLFGSDESLMETMAFRELHMKP